MYVTILNSSIVYTQQKPLPRRQSVKLEKQSSSSMSFHLAPSHKSTFQAYIRSSSNIDYIALLYQRTYHFPMNVQAAVENFYTNTADETNKNRTIAAGEKKKTIICLLIMVNRVFLSSFKGYKQLFFLRGIVELDQL